MAKGYLPVVKDYFERFWNESVETWRLLFGPSQAKVWRQVAKALDANYSSGPLTSGKIRHCIGPWEMVLEGDPHGEMSRTDMRALYVSNVDFQFELRQARSLKPFAKKFGPKTIKLGDTDFDTAFDLYSNDEELIHKLFDAPALKKQIAAQPYIYLMASPARKWPLRQYPANVALLRFSTYGVMKDFTHIVGLFELFQLLLDRFCDLGLADRIDPGVRL